MEKEIYPDGKLVDEDEGQLNMRIIPYNGRIIIDFGKEVTWIGLTAQGARDVANGLIKLADEL